MLLGKRARNLMKRTTSMTEFDLHQPASSICGTPCTTGGAASAATTTTTEADIQLFLGPRGGGDHVYSNNHHQLQQAPSTHPHQFLLDISNCNSHDSSNTATNLQQPHQQAAVVNYLEQPNISTGDSDHNNNNISPIDNYHNYEHKQMMMMMSMQSRAATGRTIQRRHSADYAETLIAKKMMQASDKMSSIEESPNFLRSCSLCERPLVPGRDIYMYRGDTAFCSLECRQQQMSQDEKKNNNRRSTTSSSCASKSNTATTTATTKSNSSKSTAVAAAGVTPHEISSQPSNISPAGSAATCQSQTIAAV